MALRWPYARALSADAVTAVLAADYLAWFIPAMALQFAMVAMGSTLRGTGNFKPGMIVQTATVVLNMALAPVLIFGWFTNRPMGVAGAAMSTLVAVVTGVIWLTTYFISPTQYLHLRFPAWKPQLGTWARMLKIGLPAGAEFGLTAVYLFVVYSVIRPFGASAQAGFGIGLRLVQALFLPVVALGFAVAPVAGQNVGAGEGGRVRAVFRSAAAMAASLMVISGVICGLGAAELMQVFTDDPQVVRVGVDYLRIVAWSFVASGIVFVSSSMFQALGNTIPPLLTSLTRIVIVAVPVIALSRTPGFRLDTIWYLSALAIGVQMFVNVALLNRELRRRLPEQPAGLDHPSLSA